MEEFIEFKERGIADFLNNGNRALKKQQENQCF